MRKIFGILAVLSVAVLAAACGSDDADSSGRLRLKNGEKVTYDNTGQWLQIEPDNPQGGWSLTLVFPDGVEWCKLDKVSGTGPGLSYVSYGVNMSEASRTARIVGNFEGGSTSVTLTQEGRGGGSDFHGWLELPEVPDNEQMVFLTHFVPADGAAGIVRGQKRNYSFWYSTQYYIPFWVAYPIHKSYEGTVGRTDAWGYDPEVSTELQVNLGTRYSGMNNGYNRGHMIPSAARTVTRGANAQTFYYTNMTPQDGTFNQRVWANLEKRVRDNWGGTGRDTLYVVTGAVLQTAGGNEHIELVTSRPENNDNKKLGVPNYYYKVLLKYTHNNGEPRYKAIGFWFENSNVNADRDVVASDSRTVRWVEEKTGINFFANLDPSIQEQVETSSDPRLWGL